MVSPADVPPVDAPYNARISNLKCSPGAHCIIASHKKIILDGGDIPGSRFENCRIIFTQNPVKMKDVKFINCVFEMPVTDAPSPYLKSTSQFLLASDLSSVEIPSL